MEKEKINPYPIGRRVKGIIRYYGGHIERFSGTITKYNIYPNVLVTTCSRKENIGKIVQVFPEDLIMI